MAGAYCKYCGDRCFVYRVIPDGPQQGWAGHLATCPKGMAHDRSMTGHDHTTATNPYSGSCSADKEGSDMTSRKHTKAESDWTAPAWDAAWAELKWVGAFETAEENAKIWRVASAAVDALLDKYGPNSMAEETA